MKRTKKTDIYDIAFKLIEPFEKTMLYPYYCPADKLTIGIGEVVRSNEMYGNLLGSDLLINCGHIREGISRIEANRKLKQIYTSHEYKGLYTREHAIADFYEKLKARWLVLAKYLPQGLTDNQCAALMSLEWNIGITNMSKSTLLKRVREHNHELAAKEFLKWNKARIDGVLRPLKGLTIRRIAEKKLYES